MNATAALVPMTPAHVDALMPHERAMFGTESWSRGAYLAELRDGLKHYVAAESGAGELLGWAGSVVVGETAEVLTVGVVPTARRVGLGRALLHDLLEDAAARGAVEMFLEVRVDNVAAIALYEDEGFVRLGARRGYYDGGRVDALTMRRELGVGGPASPGRHDPPDPVEGGP